MRIHKSCIHQIPLCMVIMTMLTASFMSSCIQKELFYPLNPVKAIVYFDWANAPNADPEGMTLMFLPADKYSKSWRFDISGREGGEIEILPGIYNVVAFNNDLPGIYFTDTEDFDLFSATAKSVSDSLTSPTGMLYGATLPSVRICNDNGGPDIVTLTPDSLSTVYHIRLDSVSGSERIKTSNAIIKGIARSVNLQSQRNSKESCALYAPLHLSPENHSILETVTTGFGNPGIPDPRITLEVIVTTSHGKYSKSFDVTDQVMNSKYPKDVYIYIKGLDIPAADTPVNPDADPDIGISVGVDGWQLIEIYYS